jgi:hypothetical protein
VFIKNNICNYNAHELLLVALRLVFFLNAWVALILIMELTIELLLARKKKCNKRDSNPLFWVCMITLPLVQPTIVIQFLIILGSLYNKNPQMNIYLLIIFILLISYNITFGPSYLKMIDYRV